MVLVQDIVEKTPKARRWISAFGKDTDSTSTTYVSYLSRGNGNGRRLIGVLANGGPPDFVAMAIRMFFLQPAGIYSSVGNGSICAEYVGTCKQSPGTTSTVAGTGAGGYLVRLAQ